MSCPVWVCGEKLHAGHAGHRLMVVAGGELPLLIDTWIKCSPCLGIDEASTICLLLSTGCRVCAFCRQTPASRLNAPVLGLPRWTTKDKRGHPPWKGARSPARTSQRSLQYRTGKGNYDGEPCSVSTSLTSTYFVRYTSPGPHK